MPNQNECDHMIADNLKMDMFMHISDLPFNFMTDNYHRFRRCPLCGARIDWQKIEEMVKDEN